MLTELRAYHDTLMSLIGEMAELTAASAPDQDRLASARLKLTQTSRNRTNFLIVDVCPALLAGAPKGDAEQIQLLQQEATRLREQSSHHIGTWNARHIAEDWPGYQRASAEIRKLMTARIEKEKKILYPLLR